MATVSPRTSSSTARESHRLRPRFAHRFTMHLLELSHVIIRLEPSNSHITSTLRWHSASNRRDERTWFMYPYKYNFSRSRGS